jgi:GTP diphosphokinase / guanosine-3',5'-bis(diphosphate) 3'-diphosphatase
MSERQQSGQTKILRALLGASHEAALRLARERDELGAPRANATFEAARLLSRSGRWDAAAVGAAILLDAFGSVSAARAAAERVGAGVAEALCAMEPADGSPLAQALALARFEAASRGEPADEPAASVAFDAAAGLSCAQTMELVAFCARRHRDQRRRDAEGTPYIVHPLGVAWHLLEGGVEDALAIAAALAHDLVEDTATTAQELAERFGERFCAVVLECTDDKALPYQERKDAQVAAAPLMTPSAGLVKVGDKISNLGDLADHPPAAWEKQRVERYFDWAALVVAPLRRHCPPRLLASLEAAFSRKAEAVGRAPAQRPKGVRA